MKYVIDASVAFKWVVPEIDSDKAERLRDDFRNSVHELLAPDFFPVELGHSLTRAERQGRIAVGDAVPLLADVLRSCPALRISYLLLLRAADHSSQFRISMYDCLYVALAEQENCELQRTKSSSRKCDLHSLSSRRFRLLPQFVCAIQIKEKSTWWKVSEATAQSRTVI